MAPCESAVCLLRWPAHTRSPGPARDRRLQSVPLDARMPAAPEYAFGYNTALSSHLLSVAILLCFPKSGFASLLDQRVRCRGRAETLQLLRNANLEDKRYAEGSSVIIGLARSVNIGFGPAATATSMRTFTMGSTAALPATLESISDKECSGQPSAKYRIRLCERHACRRAMRSWLNRCTHTRASGGRPYLGFAPVPFPICGLLAKSSHHARRLAV